MSTLFCNQRPKLEYEFLSGNVAAFRMTSVCGGSAITALTLNNSGRTKLSEKTIDGAAVT